MRYCFLDVWDSDGSIWVYPLYKSYQRTGDIYQPFRKVRRLMRECEVLTYEGGRRFNGREYEGEFLVCTQLVIDSLGIDESIEADDASLDSKLSLCIARDYKDGLSIDYMSNDFMYRWGMT